MSIPFTNPYSEPTGQTWQTMLNELVKARQERALILYPFVYTPLFREEIGPDTDYPSFFPCIRDVQDLDYWTEAQTYWTKWQGGAYTQRMVYRGMQTWINNYCTYFVNTSYPVNLAGDNFNFYTLAEFYLIAGLDARGYRRAKHWDGETTPTWLYGNMEAGDIIGPWIFEDLQKAFSAMEWTSRSCSFDGTGKEGYGAFQETEGAAKTLAAANYEASGGSTTTLEGPRSSLVGIDFPPMYYWAAVSRCYGTLSCAFNTILPEPARSVSVYFLPMKWEPGEEMESSIFDSYGDFIPPYTAMENRLSEYGVIALSAANTLSLAYGTDAIPSPFAALSSVQGYRIINSWFLCKWDFTNSHP